MVAGGASLHKGQYTAHYMRCELHYLKFKLKTLTQTHLWKHFKNNKMTTDPCKARKPFGQ